VWCDLVGPLAGDPPMLDGLAVDRAALLRGHWQHVDRRLAAPPPGTVPIPIAVSTVGGWPVAHCSSPILGEVWSDRHDHYHKKYPAGYAHWLAPDQLQQVNTTGGPLKSCRLPNRVRGVDRICWIANANWRELWKLLRDVQAIGKDRAMGYGPVGVLGWGAREAPELEGAWWYAAGPKGAPVLMRPLPRGPWLPDGLVGSRRDWGAVCSPYWHPDRWTEIVVPC
jgi:hypothetical protein